MPKLFTFSIFILLCQLVGNQSYKEKIYQLNQEEMASGNVVAETRVPEVQESTDFFESPISNIFEADIKAGLIGITHKDPIDNPYDNLFHITIPALPAGKYFALLKYQLFGITNHAGVTRSINDGQAIGGRFVKVNQEWNTQTEAISLSSLKEGDNVIRFTLPADAQYYYRVKDVSIEIRKQEPTQSGLIINNSDLEYFGVNGYLKGTFLSTYEAMPVQVLCNNRPVEINNNEFELVISRPDSGSFVARLEAVFPDGKRTQKEVRFLKDAKADFINSPSAQRMGKRGFYSEGYGLCLNITNEKSAGIDLPAGALDDNTTISINALRNEDLLPLNTDLVNVTGGAAAYRFLPHGSRFKKEAKITIPFDSSLIPEGYTAADIQTYFFNEDSRQWVALPLDTLRNDLGLVVSRTTHFTDMINGIIKVPESPQTQGYTPTSIKDIKAANPSLGITLINPPTANNMGGASMDFPLKLPNGRQGMQPGLSIQYSNEGGNGWLGLGWNLSTPSIGIDSRWGVPRFDPANETETYTIGGEQLAPIVYKSTLKPRTAEKQFHPRVEGNFDKIIRHGDAPTNYWWEVTNKSGTRSFYGGSASGGVNDSAVLKDASGNITHWALVETRDLNDNFVRYQYITVSDVGIASGTVPGIQLYIQKIFYTGNGNTDGAYSVEFIRDRDLGEAKRKDIEINGRSGFKMVTADLLRKVIIRFNDQTIRSYELKYKDGAFYKTLLESISEIDKDGVVFYSHQFDYYDDVNTTNGFTPFKATENWDPGFDNITGEIANPTSEFSNVATVLGSSKSRNSSNSVSTTKGIWDGSISKSNTVGGSSGAGTATTEGVSTFIDINGDGLPDKVFKKEGKVYYRPNLGGQARLYGPVQSISGMVNFNRGSSTTTTNGLENNYTNFWGKETSYTTNTTNEYFSDFNGDGLIDFVSDGQVSFNRLDNNGVPFFLPNSTGTPSPIILGEGINASFLAPDTARQSRQEKDFPLQDIIRFWEAPFSGTISINAPVKLQNVTTAGINTKKLDGVRVSIQQGGSQLWKTSIPAGDYSIKTPTNVSNLLITKGQRIYFRVQSVYNGNNDVVSWDPVITYVGGSQPTPAYDANNRPTNRYQASKDFVISRSQPIGINKNGFIEIDGTFTKGITSDSVRLVISKRAGSGNPVILLQKIYPGDSIISVPAPIVLNNQNVQNGDSLEFKILSDSYIDRAEISWKPHFQYTAFYPGDQTPVKIGGRPTIENYVVPDNTNFNDWVIPTPMLINGGVADEIGIIPLIEGKNSAKGFITFTVKGKNVIYGKRKLEVSGGSIVGNVDSIRVVRQPFDTLYCEFHTADTLLAANLQVPKFILKRNGISSTHAAGLYANPKADYFGTLFRGWGQFSFKGENNDAALDESKIDFQGRDTVTSYNSALYTSPTQVKEIVPVTNKPFIPLNADGKREEWLGQDTSVFVSGTLMGSSRLWLHDVSVDSLMVGVSLMAANKVVQTNSESISEDNGRSNSTSRTTNELDMMDMNGDRYPDVLHKNDIQYTLPNGGLETAFKLHSLGEATFSGTSSSSSETGAFTVASAKNGLPYNSQNASTNSSRTHGSSQSNSNVTNNDEVVSSWMDINGDGLPDKIYQSGDVALNLGYRFAEKENWGVTDIDKNNNSQHSSGSSYGFNTGFRSSQGGNSILRSNGENTTSFDDINGDGLPDKLSLVSGTVQVQLNTGGGFASAMPWGNLGLIRKNSSTGESTNNGYTRVKVVLEILDWGPPIEYIYKKYCTNPNSSSGVGISRENDLIADIDGDGFPDVLHSTNDGNLTVERSTIGRTNMLKGVKRPMGSSFTLDYERLGNTYDMPHGKWVLKSVETFDGFKGDGVDTMRNSFSYSGGLYNRDERQFYGFRRVTTNQLNTADNNAVYRSTFQEFRNNSYYTKSLPDSEWVADGQGNRYSLIKNTYDIRFVADSVYYPALVKTDKYFYEGKPTPGVSTSVQYEYDPIGNMTKITDAGDGSIQDMIIADVTYHDLNALYLKNIPATIVVTTAEGEKRRRASFIDNSGNITEIRQYLRDGTFAAFNMDYDAYGNLKKITRPANHKQQRMWYQFGYDSVVHNYVTKVEDAFGYASSSSYDFLFGEQLSTLSLNGEPMRYTLDSRGRTKTITGPYEIEANKPYTISFEYFESAAVPYAITRHHDPEHKIDINTYTFMDGMGRPLQVKKQLALFAGKGVPDNIAMVVSGKVFYDAFGRSTRKNYPLTEPLGPANSILNPAPGSLMETSTYDVMDRPVSSTLADGAKTTTTFGFSNGFFSTLITDPLQNKKEQLTDVKNRKRIEHVYGGPAGTITTQYTYNALSELLNVKDAGNNVTSYEYDNLGRKLSVLHPDAGLTTFTYDLAGNLTTKVTPQIKKEIPNSGAIQYGYEFERLIDIDYPRNYQNKVTYTYGKPGSGLRTGRLILQEDASGGQEFYYGKLGEITKTIRTVLVNSVFFTTYVSEQEYDTWNRLKKMTYPDGEVVTYHYNKGGGLNSITGAKQGDVYNYVTQLGYDEYEQRTYLLYGNGTETKYAYDSLRRRLVHLQASTASNRLMLNNNYRYDAVSNILGIVNNVQAVAGKLGGYAKQDYTYDNLYRLTAAIGAYTDTGTTSTYSLAMGYDNLYNITSKRLSKAQGSYNLAYTYGGAAPHQPTEIDKFKYKYDLNGNLLTNGKSENFWDEENRLMAVLNDSSMSRYTYDAGGERVIKSSGGRQGIWVNGSPAGIINHDSNYVTYVSPYLVCKRTSFTKHIYIESQRVATKIGTGRFANISFPQAPLTAGGIDYAKRLANLQKQRIDYYASLGISPGPPTDKLYWAHPYNSGIAAPILLDSTASSVPRGWPGNTTPPPNGPPVFVAPIPSNDSVRAGYGFRKSDSSYEASQYFYHPDHLGSTSYVTDALGEVSQHQEYIAFGETFVDEHVGGFATPYLFNAKEKDAETGLYYYGARYYDPRTSVWISVDSKAGENPALSPYNYCLNNPLMLTDPDGNSAIWNRVVGGLKEFGSGIKSTWSKVFKSTPEPSGIGSRETGQPNGRLSESSKSVNELSTKGLSFIAEKEGFRNTPYPDVGGQLTIGYGHLIKEGESFTSITEQEGMELLNKDVGIAVNAVNNNLKVPVNQHEFDALTSFTFNVGEGNFKKSTLLKMVNNGNRSKIRESFLMWNKDTINGILQEVSGLTKRREKESNLYLNGEY